MEKTIIIISSILAAVIMISFASWGAALGDSKATAQAIDAIGKRPEIRKSILTTMLISVGLIESIPIIAAVLSLVLIFANPHLARFG